MQALSSDYTCLQKGITLKYLFFKLLKIGAISFGGYMALIAMLQRELVEKDQVIEQDVITDGISIASLLPGPIAVNVVAHIGYSVRKKIGAIVAVTAILLPAALAMIILSWCYFHFAFKGNLIRVLFYTHGAVSGIILSTGANIYKKEIQGNLLKNLIATFSFSLVLLINSYLVTIGLIIMGGCLGYFLKLSGRQIDPAESKRDSMMTIRSTKTRAAIFLLVFIELLYVFNFSQLVHNVYVKISLVFSGISLSLFGGGYVMIPIMQSMVVNNLGWVTSQEFMDGIAFSQLTPGPILVSSLFIGYKLKGVTGALIALLATFVPSAILMVIVSRIFTVHKGNYRLKNVMAGIKPVVVGLIIASAVKLLFTGPVSIPLVVIAVFTFLICFKYKVDPVYIILVSLLAGTCFTFF